jgi:hypothetical protein
MRLCGCEWRRLRRPPPDPKNLEPTDRGSWRAGAITYGGVEAG